MHPKLCSIILAERKQGKQEGARLTKERLDTWHMDYLGPMNATDKQYKHLLAIKDAFSMFSRLFSTKSTTTKGTLDTLIFLQSIVGNPRRLITGRGCAFTSDGFEEYCITKNIIHILLTTGMPRGNGEVERINRCFIPILTKASVNDSSKWFKHVPNLQRALSTTYQRSIAMTLFKLMIGGNASKERYSDEGIARE